MQMSEMEFLEMATEKLNDAMAQASMLETQIQLQFDTMAQLQKEERMEIEKMYASERMEMEKRHAEEKADMRKHYRQIILSISLVLLLIVGSLIGGLIYLVSNYDFSFQTYQELSAEGGGDITNEDGIRFNQYPVDAGFDSK